MRELPTWVRSQSCLITELELVTLAYTMITVAMYIAWWKKPLNVGSPIRVPCGRPDDQDLRDPGVLDVVFLAIFGGADDEVDLRRDPIFYSGEPGDKITISADVVAFVVAIIFGGIHCIAWSSSFKFPSPKAQLLWRISSLIIVAVPVLILFTVLLWALYMLVEKRRYIGIAVGSVGAFALLISVLGMAAYIAARGILLVIAFLELSTLPCEGFRSVQWTSFIPHI
jgi:hypothetical protein